MRRLLLTFLLVFLPLQTVWAAASPYCRHEAAPPAAHFGHHAHQHQADAEQLARLSPVGDETPDQKSRAAVDVDCHACHGTGSGMVPSLGAGAIVVTVARPAQQVPAAWVHPPSVRPERPNWPAFA